MTVTWNNQPSTTTQNEVTLPASTNDTMDYPKIDVTNLVKDIWNNPSNNFGMMLMLTYENYYRSMLFGSSHCPDQTKVPVLEVCYNIIVTSVPEIKNLNINLFSVYPNPATDYLNIETTQKAIIEIFNLQRQLIIAIAANDNKMKIDVSAFPNGIYFVRAKIEKGVEVKMFVKK
jgi:hypothetical protein